MVCQDSNQLSNSAFISWLSVEEADNEVFVILCVEDHKLVLSIGDTQSRQLQRESTE